MNDEEKASYFGLVIACYLCAPATDLEGRQILADAVLHLARLYEVDAYEFASIATGWIAMGGLKTPEDFDTRLAALRRPTGF